MRDQLSRNIKFQKFCGRKNDWRAIDPPVVAAETVLDRAGEWRFRNIVGVVTTPTLRPDGTILSQSGYDPATHLLLVDPPKLPPIADNPSREDALQALELLDDLLGEFPFVDEASRSVAQSAVITPVARGAFSVAPTHVVRSSTPGSGKTYLVDVASAIATGQPCHAIAAGRTEEETEKRLGACLLAGYPMTNVDNVNGEFGGDFVCQVAERPLVSPRVLGRSEQPQLSNRMTLYATGNNIRLKGDMTRRAIICSLDAGIERPELRTFTSKPVERVLADRGRYVAAALTVVRAYFATGRPNRPPPFASYEGWSDTVRGALIWLGRPDPVETLKVARSEDPELQTLSALLVAWADAIGLGHSHARTTAAVLAEPNPALHEALDAMGIFGKATPSRTLGNWLRDRRGRIVGSYRFECVEQGKHAALWYVQPSGGVGV
jgi:putative DNA primase/helicase